MSVACAARVRPPTWSISAATTRTTDNAIAARTARAGPDRLSESDCLIASDCTYGREDSQSQIDSHFLIASPHGTWTAGTLAARRTPHDPGTGTRPVRRARLRQRHDRADRHGGRGVGLLDLSLLRQ